MVVRPPPLDPPWTLGIGLLQGPRGVRFLVSVEPLHPVNSQSPGVMRDAEVLRRALARVERALVLLEAGLGFIAY